jgi:RHS repeat-associated protein
MGATSIPYTYTYDSAGRLAEVYDGSATRTYGYDDNGNRTTYNGTTVATYDDQDRMLTYGIGTVAQYTYTYNGDRLTKVTGSNTTTYTHDAFGNLTSVTLPDDTVISYVYDGRNRLIARKTDGDIDYKLIYAGQLAPVAKLAEDDSVIETYVYATGSNSPDYIIKNSVKYRVIKDHLGSVTMIVRTSDGQAMQRAQYNEFGKVLNTEYVRNGWTRSIFGFAGGIRDSDPITGGAKYTGLTKFGARWYDPETGRWLEKEPLGFKGSYNFYSYCDGDPVNWVDVTGNLKIDPNIKNKYPNSYKRIDTLSKRLSGKKLGAFLYYGKAYCGDVYNAMTTGKGPEITSDNLGVDENQNPYFGLFRPATPDKIYLDSNYLSDYEKGLVSGEHFDTTIEHELVHYFEYKNNYNTSDTEEGYQYENY